MRFLSFYNNASFRLAETLLDSVGPIAQLLPDHALSDANHSLPEESGGEYTVATITDPSLPNVNEIVFLRGTVDVAGVTFVVAERGREGTSAQTWPVGSLVECRVTSGMLYSLATGTAFDEAAGTAAINFGSSAIVAFPVSGDTILSPGSWSIGGAPTAAACGYAEYCPMSSSVEGVGYSNVVELGIAPDYDPAQTYYPGDYVKDTVSPFTTWSYGRSGIPFPPVPVAFGSIPWAEYAPEADGNRVSFQRLTSIDVWFYPTEIGFICESYGATSPPSVTVVETDRAGTTVGNLVASQPLTGIGLRQRFVLANNITKGIKGLTFVRDTTAAGGTCRGRFYWKGLFIRSNSPEGFPQSIGSTDGT